MLEIAIMIEGQDGLNWDRWKRIARFVEEAGFVGLYRSDHFTNSNPPDLDSLELWTSLTWLADNTKQIEFGPLVTPFSFRHPVFTTRMAMAVDDLSNGRLTLGLGAGWQKREHHLFGFDLLDPKARFDRFEEGMRVVTQLLKSNNPVTFEGKFYQIHGATLLPKTKRKGGPRISIGGNGENRTLAAVVHYADEWNAVLIPVSRFSELNTRLDELLNAARRDPKSVRRSLMTGCVFGKDETLDTKMNAYGAESLEQLREHGIIAGDATTIKEQLKELEEAGLQRIMLQWLAQDDIEGLEMLANAVL